MQLIPNTRPAVPADPVVLNNPRVALSMSMPGHVKAGTPLKPDGDGWTRAESDEDDPEHRFYSHNGGWAGETVAVSDSLYIRVEMAPLVPGEKLKIVSVDEMGNLLFARDDSGRHVALSKDTVVLR